MWFKHIQSYQFESDFEHTPETLAECLTKSLFAPCTAYALNNMGWFPPLGDVEAPLVHAAGNFMMISLKIQEKILPASVVREQLEERCQAIAAQDGSKPNARQKQRIKEEIFNVLLPKALTRSTCMHGIIDKKDGWLWVNASSPAKAAVFLSALREVLGSLPVKRPEVTAPGALMTSWLKRSYMPEDLLAEDTCVMIDPSVEGGVIRCKRQDLHSHNIQSFLRDGCEINQLAMTWRDQISFVLCHDFSIKSLRFLEVIQEAVSSIHTETVAQEFDANFVIMSEAIKELMTYLMKQFAQEENKLAASKINEAESHTPVSEDLVEDETVAAELA